MKRPARSRTLQASELGSFVYCQRAWWYQRQGEVSEQQSELAAGVRLHEQHGRQVVAASALRLIGFALLLLAVILLTIYLTSTLL